MSCRERSNAPLFFVSDGTGLTAEALGHSLMTQFEDVEFKQIRIPFLDNFATVLQELKPD